MNSYHFYFSSIVCVISLLLVFTTGCGVPVAPDGLASNSAKKADLLEIYEAAIITLEGDRPTVILIENETVSLEDLGTDRDELTHVVEKYLPTVSTDMLEGFRLRNSRQYTLTDELTIRLPFVLLESMERENIQKTSWAEFYSRYPSAQGIYRVSGIGMDSDGDSALVFIHNQRSYNIGRGVFVALKREKDLWVVRNTHEFSSN